MENGSTQTGELRELRVEPVEAAIVECEVCGTRMYDLHCKISCPNCGYRRDCSDP